MFKRTIAGAGLILAMIGATNPRAKAQAGPENAHKAEKVLNAYRLDFSMNELEDGKKINTRQYSLNLNSGSSNELKIGTRVPVDGKEGEFHYIDVGTSIWSQIEDRNGSIALSVRAEVSNFASPEQNHEAGARPVLRQLEISADTLALLGKPMLVGSVDDPNSKRQFQLEVTATKLR
ncbi:MAG: hypothetical protein WBV55_02840 [Candidatus Sulfotelmatobacter sp.]